jgi:hypothetical protein
MTGRTVIVLSGDAGVDLWVGAMHLQHPRARQPDAGSMYAQSPCSLARRVICLSPAG